MDEIDWAIRTKMQVGDEVYFYCSRPVQKILIKEIVTKTEVNFDEMIDDSKFYKNEKDVKVNNGRRYIRIKILKIYFKYNSDLSTFEYLKDNGLNVYIQSEQMLDKIMYYFAHNLVFFYLHYRKI